MCDDKMQLVRCMKCSQVLQCSRYDTTALLEHIKQEHPDVMVKSSNMDQSATNDKSNVDNEKLENLRNFAAQHGISSEKISEISKMTGMSERELADEAERYITAQDSSTSKKKSIQLNKADSKDLAKRTYYRQSIQHWTPTDGSIFCPKCNCKRPPTIKTHTEFYAENNCCAQCVLSCWPLCFLPCLIPRDNREYLHCNNCQNFLGLYDRENNSVKPNRSYVECCPPKPVKICKTEHIKCN